MAAIDELKAAVKAVEGEYKSDPKWKSVLSDASKLVSEADALCSPMSMSPGQKAANEVHKQVAETKVEEAADEAKEDPKEEAGESPAKESSEESQEDEADNPPKSFGDATKRALNMIRAKKS